MRSVLATIANPSRSTTREDGSSDRINDLWIREHADADVRVLGRRLAFGEERDALGPRLRTRLVRVEVAKARATARARTLGHRIGGHAGGPGDAVVDVALTRLADQVVRPCEQAVEVGVGPVAAEPGSAVLQQRIAVGEAQVDRSLGGDQARAARVALGFVGRALAKLGALAELLAVDLDHVEAVEPRAAVVPP
jgi:hypothetical protein